MTKAPLIAELVSTPERARPSKGFVFFTKTEGGPWYLAKSDTTLRALMKRAKSYPPRDAIPYAAYAKTRIPKTGYKAAAVMFPDGLIFDPILYRMNINHGLRHRR